MKHRFVYRQEHWWFGSLKTLSDSDIVLPRKNIHAISIINQAAIAGLFDFIVIYRHVDCQFGAKSLKLCPFNYFFYIYILFFLFLPTI